MNKVKAFLAAAPFPFPFAFFALYKKKMTTFVGTVYMRIGSLFALVAFSRITVRAVGAIRLIQA